jgi:GntR family transcriptional regulator
MDEPMYRQIAKNLRERIESGEIPPGDQLPTELALRDRYNASRNTVRDAIKWLIADGVVAAKPGQGMFALQRDQPALTTLPVSAESGLRGVEGEAAFTDVKRRGRCPSASVPRVEVRPASPEMAAQLRVPERSEVVTRRQERYIDQKPWSVQTTAYPMELVTRGAHDLLVAKDIVGGTVAYLERALGVTQIGCRDTVHVRTPSEEEGRFFKIADDAPVRLVTVVIRTGYCAADAGPAPFRATSTVFPADRVQFVIDSGGVPLDVAPAMDSEPSQASVPQFDLPVPDAPVASGLPQ